MGSWLEYSGLLYKVWLWVAILEFIAGLIRQLCLDPVPSEHLKPNLLSSMHLRSKQQKLQSLAIHLQLLISKQLLVQVLILQAVVINALHDSYCKQIWIIVPIYKQASCLLLYIDQILMHTCKLWKLLLAWVFLNVWIINF